jgi:hypothetical protein
MNSGCFEGMFIHRDVVARLGLPDPRFFIYWDDSVYGWDGLARHAVGDRRRVRAAPHP